MIRLMRWREWTGVEEQKEQKEQDRVLQEALPAQAGRG
jgi:hypothetical protein